MSKLGLFSALLALAVLGGCRGNKPAGGGAPGAKGGGGGNMDAPIVVSDDLHVRHAHQKGSSAPDFQIQMGQVTASSDSGSEIKNILCKNMTIVSASSSPNCTQTGFDVHAGKPWQIDIYASSDGSGTSLLTLNPMASKPPCSSATTNCQVLVGPNNGNALDGTEDDGSTDNDATGGTDLAVYDSTGVLLNFESATLTDKSTSPTTSATMKCNNPGSHDCKILIKYQ